MTPLQGPDPSDPLAPLAAALLDRARHDADAMRADAGADASATLAEARAEADAILAEAREKGAADAAGVLAGERARAEREARGVLLVARCTAEERMRQAAHDAVSGLRKDPAYPRLVESLTSRAIHDLGPHTVITEHPRGGIEAQSPGRRLEYSLDGLADDVLDAFLGGGEGPWAT